MQQSSHIYIPLSPQLHNTHYSIQYPVIHSCISIHLHLYPFFLHLPSSTFIYRHLLQFTIIFYLYLLLSTIFIIFLLKNDYLLSAFINYHLLLPIIMHLLLPPFTCTIINLLPYPLIFINYHLPYSLKLYLKITYYSVPSFTIIYLHL